MQVAVAQVAEVDQAHAGISRASNASACSTRRGCARWARRDIQAFLGLGQGMLADMPELVRLRDVLDC